MARATHKVLLAGLGDVAQTHLKALEQTPEADVIAAVDPAPKAAAGFSGQPVPVYRTPRDAAAHHKPDVVVIATPTWSHAEVCAEIAGCFPAARILVEKPAAASLPDARRVLQDIGRHQPVDVAYHMAFSPEVTWGMEITRGSAADLGVPVAAQAFFADPYQDQFDTARSRLGNSWIDSGINSLSVLSRFAEPADRSSLRSIGATPQSVFEANLTFWAGNTELKAVILTSWHVTDPAKTTRIRYSSGAELVMDHTAVAGYLIQDGRIAALAGSDRSIPRRERHYLALYKWWLTDGNRVMAPETSLRLHELLLRPPEAPRAAGGALRHRLADGGSWRMISPA